MNESGILVIGLISTFGGGWICGRKCLRMHRINKIEEIKRKIGMRNEIDSFINLGKHSMGIGNYSNAAGYFGEMLEFDPEINEARELLDECKRRVQL